MEVTNVRDRLFAKEPVVQFESPLFHLLPLEIRQNIWSLVLTSYTAPKEYPENECWVRPSCYAPLWCDLQLLQTCRAIYSECWHMPQLLRQQKHWLTSADDAPSDYNPDVDLHHFLETLPQIHKFLGRDRVEIPSLEVYAHMSMIEAGHLAHLLQQPALHPRRLRVSIRHID